MIETICYTCKKKFKIYPYKLKYKRNYCSNHCRQQSPYKRKISSERMKKINYDNNFRELLKGSGSGFQKGQKPWNWNGGHSKNRKYQQKEWFDLIKKCYKRDNYTCQICNKKGGQLNAHHMVFWSENPEKAFDINNLITLCIPCHMKIHNKFRREKHDKCYRECI